MTGTEYLDKIYAANRKFEGPSGKSSSQIRMDWKKQLGDNKVLKERPSMAAAIFAELEDVGLPREYTGKVATGILSNESASRFDTTGFIAKNARLISISLRNMDEMQRSTFLQLLPEWDFSKSSMEQLISTAREL